MHFEPSFGQERLWFLERLDPGRATYNVPVALRLRGALDAKALERALAALVARHEVLRTTLPEVDGHPVQLVHDTLPVPLVHADLRAVDAGERAKALRHQMVDEVHRGFDLAAGPLLRALLVRVDEAEHVLVLTMHHVVTDGWSMSIVLRELGALYAEATSGISASLPPLDTQYADYAGWQREWLTDERLKRPLLYWREHLAGAPAALDLPTDRPRPGVRQLRGEHVAFSLPGALAERLRAFELAEGATRFMVLLAAFDVLLARYTGQDDVVVGTPMAGRSRSEVESLVGFFVNTVALRTRLDGEPSFREVVRRVKEASLGAFSHQDVPFERVVEALGVRRDRSRTPLFQAMFAMQQPRAGEAFGDLASTPEDIELGVAKFDLTLEVVDGPAALHASFEYDVALFDRSTIERLASHFEVLLGAALAAPDTAVAALPLMSADETKRVLVEWNDTAHEVRGPRTVHELFEAQVDRSPDAVAVEYDGARLTYRELNARANQIASTLVAAGVRLEERVAVEMRRSADMLAAMLGAMKAGAAYLPVDPDLPEDRRSYMKQDAGVAVTLDDAAVALALTREVSSRPSVKVGPENLAYVLYTSGSTGRPKGTMVEHGSVTNLLASMIRVPGITAADTTLSLTTISFDVSVAELFLPLAVGAKVVIGSRETARDPKLIAARIASSGARQFGATPATWRMMIDSGWRPVAGMEIHCAGEALPSDLADALVANGATLWNLYGPTEATVYASGTQVRAGERITIGRPLDNMRFYVLDAQMKPVPTGLLGELYIAGAGVARGYLGRPELNAEKFVPDPFSADASARMYRTGDLVRWLSDGNVDFLGRIDHQVKVRGYRIELGEIEAALSAIAEVEHSVVLAREDRPGDKQLVAYVVAAPKAKLSTESLKRALATTLPDYMIPSAFVVMGALPLNSNGKIDRKLLPAPDFAAAAAEYVAPRDGVEEALAQIFRDVLRIERVGVHDDFFALGGHSLRATQVCARIRSTLSAEIAVRVLFETPTIAALAARVRGAGSASDEPFGRADRTKPVPASFAQARLWFLDQLAPGLATYNVPLTYRVRGALDVDALEHALQALVARHEALRTTFIAIDGEPHQVIRPSAALALGRLDATDEVHARALVAREMHAPFDLAHGPMLRATLVRVAAGTHLLVLVMHHVATDGWSMNLLSRELSSLYTAFAAGGPSSLDPASLDYADFSVWQRGWLKGDVLASQIRYWREHLAGAPAGLEIPTDRPRPVMKQYRGASVEFLVPSEVTDRLHALCRRQSATPFMVLLAAYQALLSRWSGQTDIVVGTPIANRTRHELESVVGFFVNTLALRTSLDGAPSFDDLVARVKGAALAAYSHQDVPFEKLVDELRVPRDTSRTPVYQAMFVMQNTAQDPLVLGDLAVSDEPSAFDISKTDLSLSVHEAPDGVHGLLDYDVALFDRSTIERFASHFEVLLRAALAAPDVAVSALPLMDADEKKRVLVEWNDTAHEVRGPRTVHELFEAQVDRSPDAVAVEYDGARLTYRELDARANQIAAALIAAGVRLEERVAVEMRRSADMLAAMLGAMKAGAAYLPVDPDLPDDRRSYMKEDAGVAVTLDDAAVALAIATRASARPSVNVSAENLAYVLYTSGSTGRPKGTMVEHRSVTNLLASMIRVPGITAADTTLSLTTISFDVSVAELFLPLAVGAKVVIGSRETARDPKLIAALIASSGARQFGATPATWRMMVDSGWQPAAGMEIHCAGEALPADLADALVANGATLWNLYGPTEATVYASGTQVRAGERITIGRPLDNMRFYVLDPQMSPVPAGLLGELYIAGAGVARGYLGRPELSAEKFVPDPFASEPSARMYRTGDLVRWLSNGSVDFLGRIDHQVKIRGYRIELGEIEAALSAIAGVDRSVVLAREDRAGDKRLVAYVVGATGVQLSTESLKSTLATTLPDYMIPSAFVMMEALPLNSNGKIDRKLLPAPDFAAAAAEYVAPRDGVEEALAQIFRDVLRIERVGVHDDFFALGGHSLRATQVCARIRSTLSVEVAVRVLFETPTVAALAARVRGAAASLTEEAIARADRTKPLPASFAQARIWFLDQLEPGAATYNVPLTVRVRGALDVDALERALQALVARHEALRTTFVAIDGEPHQVVRPSAALALALSLSRLDATDEDHARMLVARESHAPFDLAHGPIMRATLVRVAADTHVLVLVIHHVATDGWSMNLLSRELSSLYTELAAGSPSATVPASLDYADFSVWQRGWLKGDVLAGQIAYWKEHLAGAPAGLELPTDRPRPVMKQYRGASVELLISREVTDRLHALCRRQGATPFMVLLAAYQAVLSRWSGQTDIVVGTPIANRTRHELESVVGFFVNTLALRTSLDGAPSFEEVVARVKRAALAAYSHQDVPFERLVDELRVPRDTGRTPVYQAMFVMQNTAQDPIVLGDLAVTNEPSTFEISKTDLSLSVHETADGLHGLLDYDVALFERSTMERFASHFEVLLGAALAAPESAVAALPLMSAAETKRVLVEWNDTAHEVLGPRTVHELFEAQVDRSPDAVAIQYDGAQLTYRELDSRANRIAATLVAAGVGLEERVAVEMRRSADMLAAMLGAMKAGAAYLPVDPDLPEDRRRYMKDDAGVAVTLDEAAVAKALDARPPSPSAPRPRVKVSPENLAYVLYTSGSTGRPKGTMVEHRSVTNLLASMIRVPGITAADTTLSLTTISFDVSVAELFLPLAVGAKVVIGSRETARDPKLIAALIASSGARQFGATPATWRMMVDSGWQPVAGMEIHCAGEALPSDLADALVAKGATLWNLYGPTEATVYASGTEVRAGERITIGRPLDNMRFYVLDAQMKPLPTGLLGELYIAGAGVARGYLGRPELNAEKFVRDPFAADPSARMYRTGDLVRWLSDGNVDFLGRIDHQVKIRGYRIELGEIEAALSAIAEVEHSVVLAREDRPGDKRLVGYVVAAPKVKLSTESLKNALATTLPDYMIPSAFVMMDALPLNSNGKVDRKALPAPDFAAAAAEYVAPRTATEGVIAAVFCETLLIERAGAHDDFFALGGHSLLAIRVVTKIRERLGVSVPVRALFEASTVSRLAAKVDGLKAGDTGPRLERVESRHRAPLSHNQRMWWDRQKRRPASAGFNYVQSTRIRGKLDTEALARSIDEEVRRHDALRTTIEVVAGEPVQVIHTVREGVLEHVDVSGSPPSAVADFVHAQNGAPGLLDGGPLPRVTLLRLGTDDHMLVMGGHRLLLDPTLCDTLLADVLTIYEAFAEGAPSPLGEPAFQYVDFVAWQRKCCEAPDLREKVATARRRLAGAPGLALPFDRPAPDDFTTRSHVRPTPLDDKLWTSIAELARAESTTQFVVLSALLKSFLSVLTGQSDVTIIAPNELTHGLHESLSGVFGCFFDFFVLRTDLSGAPTLRELVRREHLVVMQSQREVDVPCVLVTDDYVEGPLWRVALNFIAAPEQHGAPLPKPVGIEVEPVAVPRHRMVDLAWAVFGRDAALFASVDKFDPSTAEHLAARLVAFLREALPAPDHPLR